MVDSRPQITVSEEEFRGSCRGFLRDQTFEVDLSDDSRAVKVAREFQRRRYRAGLAGLAYPVEFGGRALGDQFELWWQEEAAAYPRLDEPLDVGMGMCLPTIYTFGSRSQKLDYMPALLRGDALWCQLFSEPNAGSDLASLRTTANPVENGWVVNGEKVWTTFGHHADMGLLLARTDASASKHRGLSLFLIDLKSDGVWRQPLRDLSGLTRFSQIRFNDVHLDSTALLGDLNLGWQQASTTLTFERFFVRTAVMREGRTPRFDQLCRDARARHRTTDPVLRDGMIDLYIRETLLAVSAERDLASGESPGPHGSLAKLATSLISAEFRNLAFQVLGADALAWRKDSEGAKWLTEVLTTIQYGIGGGTNEIQRNIIAERILGLPREMRPSQ